MYTVVIMPSMLSTRYPACDPCYAHVTLHPLSAPCSAYRPSMTIPSPDAYLTLPTDLANQVKMAQFISHLTVAPIGSKIPMSAEVQWIDSLGNPTKTGTISGTVETLIEFDGEAPIAVLSTGEKISLSTISE